MRRRCSRWSAAEDITVRGAAGTFLGVLLTLSCSGGSGTPAPAGPTTPTTPAAPTPATLQVQTMAGAATSGSPLAPQPVVRILDAANALVTSGSGASLLVTAARGDGSGTLAGTTSVGAVGGIATFSDLVITGSGPHTLRFVTATPALQVTSPPIVLTQPPPPAAAIALAVGGAASATVAPNADLLVPLTIDMTNRGSLDLASIALVVTWNPDRLSYVANAAGNWTDRNGTVASLTLNANAAGTGLLSLAGFTPLGTAQSFTLCTFTFRGRSAGTAGVVANVTTAGSETGSPVTVSIRNLTVTVTP